MIFNYFENEYYEKIKPYVTIAYLYDKLSSDGLISSQFINTWYTALEPKYENLFDKNLDSEQYREVIEELIDSRNLNRKFCNRLSNNNSLRYLVAVGFHECTVVSDLLKDSLFSIILDDDSFGRECNRTKVKIIFTGVSLFKEELYLNNELTDIANKVIDSGYEFNRCFVRWTESDRLFVQFKLDTYGEPYYSRYIKFECSDVKMSAVEK